MYQALRKILKSIYNANDLVVLLCLCALYGLSAFVNQKYVVTEELYFNSVGEQLTTQRVAEIIKMNNSIIYVQLALLPFFTTIQVLLTTFFFNIGALLYDIKVKFSVLFSTVLRASLIFGVGKLFVSYFCLLLPIETLIDISKADIFSLNGLVANLNLKISDLARYPLSLVSIIEVLFCVFIIEGLKGKLTDVRKGIITQYVVVTYVCALLLFTLGILFLQINTL